MTKVDYQKALAELQQRNKQIIKDLQSGKLQNHQAAELIVNLDREKDELIESLQKANRSKNN